MINKEISQLIKSRKSIYPNEFNGSEIDKEVIIELLQNANHAPTHKLTQPWVFKIFSSNSKTKLLNEIFKINTEMDELKKNQLSQNFQKSSHIICICMKENSKLLPEWEEISATAMAVQNIWISCSGTNIGGYWSTPKYAKRLHSFLSLSENERCLGFFYLGVHDSNTSRISRRKNILEKTEWFE